MSMASAFCGPKRATDDFITGVTHHLINKVRDKRAAWESEIDSSNLSHEQVTKRFFTPSSDVPKLDFVPSTGSTDASKKDSTYGRFREWGLPELHWVKGIVTGDTQGSGSYKVTEDELVDRVLGWKGETRGGGRADDMERLTRELVGKFCEKDSNGYLTWPSNKSKY